MDISHYTIENMLGFNINRAAIIFRKRLSQALKDKGIDITPEEFAILSRLWEDDGILQNHLVEKTLKDKTRVARLLGNLKDKSLIYKEINEDDKRKQFVYLTPQGRKLQSVIVPIVLALMAQAGGNISPEELETTQKVLRQIFSNLNEG